MKILVIALSGIGDALMFTPAVKALKQCYPESQIDCLAMYKGVKDIYERLPEINKVIYHDFLNKNNFTNLFFVLKLANQYEASFSVYPSNRWHYTLISRLINAEKRMGVRYLHKDFQNLGFLNNVTTKEDESLHNVEENLRLVEKYSGQKNRDEYGLMFPLTGEDENFAESYITEHVNGSNNVLIGFHPGCSELKNHVNRRWAPEKFAELAEELIKKKKAKVFVFGGPDEDELKQSIVDQVNSDNIFNVRTENLAQTAAIMKRMNVFVSNDSSLMHVAAALKLKVVAIIGPTNVNFIKPWKTKHRVASLNLECAPCFYYSPKPLTCTRTDVEYKCVRELDAQLVYDHLIDLLQILNG